MSQEAAERARETGEMPLDFLLRMMRDPGQDEAKRIDCAKAAAPYLHAKRAPVNADGEEAAGVTVIVNKP